MTLKELRIWHWKEVLKHSKVRNFYISRGLTSEDGYLKTCFRYSFHLGAVQALNDILPGTAEGDLNEQSRT